MRLEQLLRDLASIKRMLFVIGDADAVSEMFIDGTRAPTFEGGYAMLETESWHFHLRIDAVDGVQFVEADNHVSPKLYYVRFSDARGDTLLRVYFPNPYLDDNDQPTAFQSERLKLFEAMRDNYVGQEGITFVRRPRQEGRHS